MASTDQLLQYLVSGVTQGSVYALVAIGFTLIFNVTGIINFAQGEFVMLGGMVSFWLLHTFALPTPLAFLLAIAVTATIGSLLQRLAIHPAKDPSTLTLIIITVGASILLRGLAGQLWGKDAVPLPAFSGEAPILIGSATITPQSLWVIGTMLVTMLALKLVMEYSMIGKALRACSLNQRAAGLLGINTRAMSLASFSLSAALGALAGIVIAPITLTSYDAGTMLGVKGFAAAALGGFGSQFGAVLGGLFLGVAEALGAAFISSSYKDAIALLVLFLVLLARNRTAGGEH